MTGLEIILEVILVAMGGLAIVLAVIGIVTTCLMVAASEDDKRSGWKNECFD